MKMRATDSVDLIFELLSWYLFLSLRFNLLFTYDFRFVNRLVLLNDLSGFLQNLIKIQTPRKAIATTSGLFMILSQLEMRAHHK
jgi:hypothetical protein